MGVAVIGTIICDAVLCILYCALYFVAAIHSDRDSSKPYYLSSCLITVTQLMRNSQREHKVPVYVYV
jgi:hypothetical protein